MASLDMLERNDTSLENIVDLEKAACYSPTVNADIAYSLNVSTEIDRNRNGKHSIFFGYVSMMIPGTILVNRMGFYNYLSLSLLATRHCLK